MSADTRREARDARRALREGPEGIARRQRARLAELVAYARTHSPFYRELYRDLPDGVDDPELLPVVDKPALMDRFDDWVTDRTVTRAAAEAFVDDPDLVGARFAGRYMVATTSGSTGVRGIFVMDERSVDVSAVIGGRARSGLGLGDVPKIITTSGRTAVVCMPGGHFVSSVMPARFRRDHPLLGRIMRVFSASQPMEDLAAQLQRYRPISVAGFVSVLLQLADLQESGRMRIRPVMLLPGGETVTPEIRARLTAAFGAKIRSAYAATECGFLGYGCPYDWYHVNADWAVLEPVDAEHRPVPPGEPSHTVLLSNLANRVQPILRYDLGDSVVLRPDACPCGSPLPAVRVQGRAADLLTFPTSRGEPVTLSPMLFGTVVDRTPGIDRFQLVQTAPGTLRVRMRAAEGADADQVWRTVMDRLGQVLAEHKADDVTLERADEPPQRAPSGKLRRVIPLP